MEEVIGHKKQEELDGWLNNNQLDLITIIRKFY